MVLTSAQIFFVITLIIAFLLGLVYILIMTGYIEITSKKNKLGLSENKPSGIPMTLKINGDTWIVDHSVKVKDTITGNIVRKFYLEKENGAKKEINVNKGETVYDEDSEDNWNTRFVHLIYVKTSSLESDFRQREQGYIMKIAGLEQSMRRMSQSTEKIIQDKLKEIGLMRSGSTTFGAPSVDRTIRDESDKDE